MPENLDWVHPLDAMAKREPLPNAAVRVIVIATEEEERAAAIGDSLAKQIRQRGRQSEATVVRADANGWDRGLERALEVGDEPLVVITTATAPWTSAHLTPLLDAIDRRDHAIGRRHRPMMARVVRWLVALPYRFLFAVPVADIYSPLRIHRREKLAAISLQSSTRFVDVEILAKATFLVQTIEEVDVPDLPSPQVGPVGHSVASLFSRPILRAADRNQGPSGKSNAPVEASGSGPAEEAEGQGERADGPGDEDRQGGEDVAVGERRPLEHHPAETVEELGER